MLLKEFYTDMYGKLITEVDDDQMIKYKDADGESKEMSAKAAKRMSKDHPAKVEYDKQQGDGGGDTEKSVNIFDEPADSGEEPSTGKSDDDLQIGGPNGLEIGRDEIKKKLLDDPEIAKILGDEDDVYWDDADLVSSKHDDATIASIDDESDMTIGDIKKAIKDYREDSDDDMNENFSNKNVNFRSIKENWIKNNL